MLDCYDRRHKNINIMALDLEHAVSKKLEDPLISFHYLALLFLRSIHYDHCGVFSKHQIELILTILHGLKSFHLVIQILEFFSLIIIILNLRQVVTIKVQSIRVVRINLNDLFPDLIDFLSLYDYIQAKFINYIQVYHVWIQMRPELNMISSRLFNLLY